VQNRPPEVNERKDWIFCCFHLSWNNFCT
jgi:hypothetical protein